MRSLPTGPAAGLASIPLGDNACSLALAAAVAASAQPAQPDAALLDLGRQWSVIRRRWTDLDQRDATLSIVEYTAQANIISADERATYAAAAVLPATTAGGLAVKARLLAAAADCEANDDAGIAAWAYEITGVSMHLEQAVGSLVADLLRLAQEAGQ